MKTENKLTVYRERKSAYNITTILKDSKGKVKAIFSSMLSNIGSALNIWNRNKRQAKLDEETLRVLGLRAPNANKLVLSALGY